MDGGLIETAARLDAPDDRRIFGVAPAQVVNNIDETNMGRVQVRLPWMPGFEPWARVSALMAGDSRGTYFIPQVGDEVLVAFNQGDVREPFVVGSLWNGQDSPPAQDTSDPVNTRMIRTPTGHEIAFDEVMGSISITSADQQKITIDPDKVEVTTAEGTAVLTLETAGNVSLKSTVRIDLQAPTISIQGDILEVKGQASASIDGGGVCQIQGALVKIN
jgi:phage baseplate assembly protein V